jgi:Polysaccharide deacetylase
MGRARLSLAIFAFGLLSACSGPRDAPLATVTAVMADTSLALPAHKLIALTFDDGPRPYVLFGTKGVHPAPGLGDILDQNGVKATFFVVGWRLTPQIPSRDQGSCDSAACINHRIAPANPPTIPRRG